MICHNVAMGAAVASALSAIWKRNYSMLFHLVATINVSSSSSSVAVEWQARTVCVDAVGIRVERVVSESTTIDYLPIASASGSAHAVLPFFLSTLALLFSRLFSSLLFFSSCARMLPATTATTAIKSTSSSPSLSLSLSYPSYIYFFFNSFWMTLCRSPFNI